MADAKKCDRCGKFYDIPTVVELLGFRWLSMDDSIRKSFDLCSDCIDALSDFMEGAEPVMKPYVPEPDIVSHTAPETAEPNITSMEILPEPAGAPQSDPNAESGEVTRKKLTEEDAVRLRLSGMMPTQIAEEYGYKPNAVSGYICNFKQKYPERYAEMVAEAEKSKTEPVNPT